MPAGSRFARTAYVMFAVAVLLALLRLGGFSDERPFFLRMVPATPVAKAAQPVAGEGYAYGDQALDLPDARAAGPVGRLLAIGSGASSWADKEESARTGEPSRDEAPVFYRPSWEEDADGGPVCDDLGGFPESSRLVFPLPEDYSGSYEDTWGAARPQGGHEGTDLMSPPGTPEFAITDGTIVPVKGANENGWNRLGGYTVMLEAAHDAGPIKAGDLFYYAHMEEESALEVGTEVRAGEQVGVVGDTGEGREATRGKFPAHLHFGWYDAGSASSRTNLESGAMNPYPLLLWLEEYGGSIAGGTDAPYCEAPRAEPAPNSSATNPDLDTDDRNDARPSPVVEQDRQGQNPPKPERKIRIEEKGERTSEKSGETGAAGDGAKANPAGSSEKDDGAGEERSQGFTPDAAPETERTSGSSTSATPDASNEDGHSQAEIRAKIRTLLRDPPPPDPASRRSRVSALAEVLRETEKKHEHDSPDAGKPDKKKQTDREKQRKPKRSPEPTDRKEPRKARSVPEAKAQNTQPADEDAPAPKRDREEDSDATGSKGRKPSESGAR